MIKHKLIINGTHTIDSTVLTGFSLTESVNEGQDLTLGSVCSAMMEFSVRVIDGAYLPQYGDKVTLLESDGSEFAQHGIFYVEKTKQVTDRVYKVTAYDAVSRLDKDIAEWLQTVTFPISLYSLTSRAIQQCGVSIANASIPNGDYQVKEFQASGITARNICKWAGEISARFCRATDDGKISFDWYDPAGANISYSSSDCNISDSYSDGNLSISSDCVSSEYVGENLNISSDFLNSSYSNGELFVSYVTGSGIKYYMNSFNREAFQITPIEKVQIQSNADDIGTIFPDVTGEKNTYKITGNYLLTADSGTALKPIAKYIYNQLKNVVYTPANVMYPSDFRVKVGNTVRIATPSGKKYTSYVMRRVESGSKDSIYCYGNKTRLASMAVNNQSLKALEGKYLNLSTDVDGVLLEVGKLGEGQASLEVRYNKIETRVSSVEGNFSQLTQTVDGITGRVQSLEGNYSSLSIAVEQIQGKVSNNTGNISTLTQTVNGFETRITTAEGNASTALQTANGISATVTTKLDKSGGALSSFGWALDSSQWQLSSNGQTVFKVDTNGAYVNGEIRATTGQIGSLRIGAYNPNTNTGGYIAIESGGYSTYIGPPNASLFGKYIITAGKQDGTPDAESSYPFRVGADGSVYAENGYFHGHLYAGMIHYGDQGGGKDAGYLSGSGLTGKSVDNTKTSDGINSALEKAITCDAVLFGKTTCAGLEAIGTLKGNNVVADTLFSFKGYSCTWKQIDRDTWAICRLSN